MSHTLTLSRAFISSVKSRYLNLALVFVFLCIAALMFYNLDINPRSWHDEGGILSVAKTLSEDGVYGIRNSDGYQTFGPVQSVGPTVILPVFMAFKILGISLLSARIIAVIYSIAALLLFFTLARKILDLPSACLGCVFLISYTATSFFYYGRQVHGAYPALAFFLGALLAYERGYQTRKRVFFFISGILIGGAMITKSQYTVMAFGTIAVLVLLDFFFNRRKNLLNLLITGAIAAACFALWMAWQYAYYGPAVFIENSEKLSRLALSTSGFHPVSIFGAVRYFFGRDSGHFFLYWGFPAIIYVGIMLIRSREVSSPMSFLFVFNVLWLFYFTFWTLPWSENCIAPSVVTAIFVGKLCSDVIGQLIKVFRENIHDYRSVLSRENFRLWVPIMACLPILAYTGYSLEKLASADIFDKVGEEQIFYRGPRSFQELEQISEYINDNIPSSAVVETWERELFISANHIYHFPDQSILADSHYVKYLNGIRDYQLGKDYFMRVRPDYLVIGWFERYNPIYDMEYLSGHAKLMKSFGNDMWRYDLFQLNLE